jgi:hypothetical protein
MIVATLPAPHPPGGYAADDLLEKHMTTVPTQTGHITSDARRTRDDGSSPSNGCIE